MTSPVPLSACLVLARWLALPLLASTAAARADVLEIGPAGAVWVAGGPTAVNRAPSPAPQPGTALHAAPEVASYTVIADSAGPAAWQPHVAALAARYELSPALLEAVVWQESRWNTAAVSPAGARGLAQLMPATGRQLGVDWRDPQSNLEGGARYLRMQLDRFDGDVEKALAAYNAGPERVARAGGVPNIRETRQYVAAIMARLAQPLARPLTQP